MIPKSLSATSAQVFELCAARWVAEFFVKAESPSGKPANLGTLCHTVLEKWVLKDLHLDPGATISDMENIYENEYYATFETDTHYKEGMDMLRRWYERSHPLPHKVLSTETKESFPLKVGGYEVPFNYIWDRCDEHPNGEIEVIDYKTVMAPLSPDSLKDKVQARCYAVAAQIKYPNAPRIWVTFDLLRHDAVGVVFTREQNIATYKWLKNLLKRILQTDGSNPPETLNPDCRWCVRKHVCGALRSHAEVGGVLAKADPQEAADERVKLDSQKKALEQAITELDEFILGHCEREDVLEFSTDSTEVKLTASSRRKLDSSRAAPIVGPEVMAKYGNLRMGDVDELLKGTELNSEQKSQLRQLLRREYGEIKVKTAPKNPIDT